MLSLLETQKENEKKNMQGQTDEAQPERQMGERAVFRIRTFLGFLAWIRIRIRNYLCRNADL